MVKALVTGGSGFIGSNIVRLLLENNIEMHVIDNLSSSYSANIPEYISKGRIEFVGGDIRDYRSIANSMDGIDVMFHPVVSVGRQRSIDNPQLDSGVNIIGTINILEAIRHAGTKRIMCSSSTAIFGELTTPTVDEEYPQNAGCQYGVSKFAAEKIILAYSRLCGFEGVCLRYFNIYDVNQCFDLYGNVIPIFAKRIFSGEPIIILDDGGQTRDFLNADDVARINYIAAMNDVKSDVFNIESGNSTTIDTLARMMQRISGINVDIHCAPERIGDVKHYKANADKTFNRLGYKVVVGLGESLKKCIDWYKKNCVQKR